MVSFTAALSAAAIGLNIYGTVREGQIAKQTADYNASLYNAQAKNTEVAKDLTKEQYARKKDKFHGSTIVAITGQGRDLSGSALHVLNDTLTQLEMDEKIELYNLDIKQSQLVSAASQTKRSGNIARTSSYIDASTSLLTGGNDWYQKYGGFGKA